MLELFFLLDLRAIVARPLLRVRSADCLLSDSHAFRNRFAAVWKQFPLNHYACRNDVFADASSRLKIRAIAMRRLFVRVNRVFVACFGLRRNNPMSVVLNDLGFPRAVLVRNLSLLRCPCAHSRRSPAVGYNPGMSDERPRNRFDGLDWAILALTVLLVSVALAFAFLYWVYSDLESSAMG